MNNEKTTEEAAGPFLEWNDQTFHLEKGFNLIGSLKDSNHLPWILIEDKNVDSKHAAIKYDDALQIIDLGSTNGTFINDVQISPFEWLNLNTITILRFGNQKVTVNKNQRLNDDSGLCNHHNSSSTKDISLENTSKSPKSSTPTFPEKNMEFLVPSTQRELSKSIDDLMFNEEDDEDITIPETQQDEFISFSSEGMASDDVQEESQSIFKCLNEEEEDTDCEIELQTNNFKVKSQISPSNKENRSDELEATQMFKKHRLLDNSTENSLCETQIFDPKVLPTDEDFLDELDELTQMSEEEPLILTPEKIVEDSLPPTQMFRPSPEKSKESEVFLAPTQMFRPSTKTKEPEVDDDKSEDLEETQIFDPMGKDHDFLAPTQMFRPSTEKSTKSKEPEVDDDLLPTQMFRPSLDKTEDLEETQIFHDFLAPAPSRPTPEKEDVYMALTQQIVLKRPEPIKTEDECYFAATQKIDLSRMSRTDSPDLFEADDEYCLAPTQILESSKTEKKKTDLKKVNRVLVSSSESDSESDEAKPIFATLKKTEKTPAKVKTSAGCSSSSKKYRKDNFCTPEQDFLLPKVDELNMAEQLFKKICRETLKETGNDSDNSDKDDSEKPTHELDDLDIITNEPAGQPRTTRTRSASKKLVSTPKAVIPKKIGLRTRSSSKGSVSSITEEVGSATKTRSHSKKKEVIASIAEEPGTSPKKQTPRKKDDVPGVVTSAKKSASKKKDDILGFVTSAKKSTPKKDVSTTVTEVVTSVKKSASKKKDLKVSVTVREIVTSAKKDAETSSSAKKSDQKKKDDKIASKKPETVVLKRSTRINKNEKEIVPEILSASIKSPEFPVVESNTKVLRVRTDKKTVEGKSSKKRALDSSTECESEAKKQKQSDSIVSETSSEKVRSTRLKPKILVTRFEITERQIAIIKKLGGSIVERTEQADILLTEKVYRTWKFLSSLARGIPIVSPKWMEMVESKNKFYEYERYLLSDPTGESRLNFNLKESLKLASEKLLYDGFTIYVTPRTLPTYAEIFTIIKCAGGKCVDNIAELPEGDENVFVISSVADKNLWTKIKAKFPKIIVIDTEAFMISILKQNVVFPKNHVIC